jgi:hypothetical protein
MVDWLQRSFIANSQIPVDDKCVSYKGHEPRMCIYVKRISGQCQWMIFEIMMQASEWTFSLLGNQRSRFEELFLKLDVPVTSVGCKFLSPPY